MPPQTFECCVCGETVSKRQSLDMGVDSSGEPRRACKVHEEAKAHKTEKDIREERGRKLEKKKEEERQEYFHRSSGSFEDAMKPKCWHCQKPGVKESEFFSRLMINMEKIRMLSKGSKNFFDEQFNAAKMTHEEYASEVVLQLIDVRELEEWKLNQLIRDFAQKQAAQFGGFALICVGCAKEFGVLRKPIELSSEQMSNWMVVAELMRPDIKKQAAAEINCSNQKN